MFVVAVILALPLTAFAEFVASADAKKYHNPKCSVVKNIKKENLVKFNSVEAAKKLGFEPCDICKPPTK
jgi:methylphosphotriester-DNA--protein-cysteine methyltransferase